MAIANNRADSVRRFTENPKTQRKKNVPMSATGTAIIGMSVERKSCRKMYTTKNTRNRVMISVLTTSAIDAKRNSVTSCSIVYFIPGGMLFCASARAAFTSVAMFVALDPAICWTIPMTAGLPLFFRNTLYISCPCSIFATSRRWSV